MPWKQEWVDPEVALTAPDANGDAVVVYHCYKDDDADDRLTYHFTTIRDNEAAGIIDYAAFIGFVRKHTYDVRELMNNKTDVATKHAVHAGDERAIRQILCWAVCTGRITAPRQESR